MRRTRYDSDIIEGRNRKLNRWQGYDYSSSGLYYVTICTRKRIEWFGDIKNGKMVLNEYGKIADKLWREIPNHYNGVIVDIHQIMSNHMHGVIGICHPRRDDCRDKACLVPTIAITKNQIIVGIDWRIQNNIIKINPRPWFAGIRVATVVPRSHNPR